MRKIGNEVGFQTIQAQQSSAHICLDIELWDKTLKMKPSYLQYIEDVIINALGQIETFIEDAEID